MQTLTSGLQHRRRLVDGDHPRDKRRERGADTAGTAAEIPDDPLGIGQGRERGEMKAIAEQLVAYPVPVPRRRGEKLLRLRPALGKRCAEPALILASGRGGPDLFADEQPQPARGGVELVTRHRVQPAGALRARRDPPAVRQRLQVTAHRGLRKLHDPAQLRDSELVPVEQQQNAAARRIGERGEVIQDGGGAAVHLIRLSGLNDICGAAVKRRHFSGR